MADYFPAEIEIGGPLSLEDEEKLVAAISEDCPRLDWDMGPPLQDEAARRAVRSAIEQGKTLRLFDADARYGEFGEIESACQRLDLTFVRKSDAKYEYDGEVVWWEPGRDHPLCTTATQNGHPTVAVSQLRKILASESLGVKAKLTKINKFVDEMLPCDVPPLSRKG